MVCLLSVYGDRPHKSAHMKKLTFSLLPVFIAGLILLEEQKGNVSTPASQYDGPYVFYSGDKILVKYVIEDGGVKTGRHDSVGISEKASLILQVATDEPGKTFPVQLKSSLQNEATEYAMPSKMFIVSDMEGNFKAFKKLSYLTM